jgi:hypothetical protein
LSWLTINVEMSIVDSDIWKKKENRKTDYVFTAPAISRIASKMRYQSTHLLSINKVWSQRKIS